MKIQSIVTAALCGITLTVTVNATAQMNIQAYDPAIQHMSETEPMKKNAAQNTRELLHESGDPIQGNPDGPVTLVEFFDYNCTHCNDMDPIIQSLARANPNLRIVFKEFPIRGDLSTFKSKAALAAAMQGKYVPLHVALMHANGGTQENVLAIAKSKGIDVDKMKSDMSNSNIAQKINSNYLLAQTIGITATPAIIITKTYPTSTTPMAFYIGEASLQTLQNDVNKLK